MAAEAAIWFTRRERQVLELFSASPRSNKEIGSALGISASTVKAYFGSICSKLKVENRLHLYAWCVANPAAVERGVFRPADGDSLRPAA